MTELLCKSEVKKLLKAGINYKEYPSFASYLSIETNAPTWDFALEIAPKIKDKFWHAMKALQKELVPQYVDINSLYSKLWGLLREIVLNKSIYQNPMKLEEKISVFANELKKPLLAFEVLYEIKNFSIGKKQIKLENAEILELTKVYLKELGLAEFFTEKIGETVILIKVEAAEIINASAAGRTRAESILNMLRVAVKKELLTKDDHIFKWEIGSSIAFTREKPGDGITWSWGRSGKAPLIKDMGDNVVKSLSDKKIWKYLLENKMPKDIQTRVNRALEWISYSIATTNLDNKLVNVCTALEILLLPDYKNRHSKGALIALRQVLVRQNVFDSPAGILSLYKQRNNIIHNGYLNITGTSDYNWLLDCCVNVLVKIVRLSQKYQDIDKLEELLGKVESKVTLEDFIKHCEWGIHKGRGIKEIKKLAYDLLNKYE